MSNFYFLVYFMYVEESLTKGFDSILAFNNAISLACSKLKATQAMSHDHISMYQITPNEISYCCTAQSHYLENSLNKLSKLQHLTKSTTSSSVSLCKYQPFHPIVG